MPETPEGYPSNTLDANGPYPMRLQKFLREAGVASRRRSEDLMTAGRVSVNGEVVTVLGSKVDPLTDVVCVDGVPIEYGRPPVYLMLNKPAGYLTTMSDPQGRKTVATLVPTATVPGLYPVGRLDKMTRGLLLFTTDGSIGNGLLHPSHHVDKTYLARVEGTPSEYAVQRLRDGVELDDGLTAPAIVEVTERGESESLMSITIHEGRHRQVRRMCSCIGHECIDLQRVSFGPLLLGSLEEGQWRMLDASEVRLVRIAAGQSVIE